MYLTASTKLFINHHHKIYTTCKHSKLGEALDNNSLAQSRIALDLVKGVPKPVQDVLIRRLHHFYQLGSVVTKVRERVPALVRGLPCFGQGGSSIKCFPVHKGGYMQSVRL